jgi:hypothetical protein
MKYQVVKYYEVDLPHVTDDERLALVNEMIDDDEDYIGDPENMLQDNIKRNLLVWLTDQYEIGNHTELVSLMDWEILQFTEIADGEHVVEGARVFNYYDRKWGHIVKGSMDDSGWFRVQHEDGTVKVLNGERITFANPQAH